MFRKNGSIKKIKCKDMIHGKNKKNPTLFDYTYGVP